VSDRRGARRRTRGVRPTLTLLTLVLSVLVAACGGGERDAVDVPTQRTEGPAPMEPSREAAQLYEVDAIVFDDDEDLPSLSLSGCLMMLPPQCARDLPITNWDWEAVEGEESASGTTSGAYHLVGTYDGEMFTVVEIGPYDQDELSYRSDFSSPCPEPEGGWVVPDPEHHTQEQARKAHAYARAQPDYVISWDDHLDEDLQEFSPVVLVAIFTGDADGHEAQIRAVWDGPLCVLERDLPTARELARIRTEVETRLPELSLELLGSFTGGFPPAIYIEVVADVDGRAQALVDREYGPGLVRFLPALRPVEE
jgi:hypothetical protein